MENTLENKAKFFAQYFGQQIAVLNIFNDRKTGKPKYQNGSVGLGFGALESRNLIYINLKPLSSITLVDANAITIYGEYAIKNGGFNDFGFDTPQGRQMYGYASIDFLRSKGYALPFMGLSLDQLIEYGWFNLKETA